jgi:hypothetical protein
VIITGPETIPAPSVAKFGYHLKVFQQL